MKIRSVVCKLLCSNTLREATQLGDDNIFGGRSEQGDLGRTGLAYRANDLLCSGRDGREEVAQLEGGREGQRRALSPASQTCDLATLVSLERTRPVRNKGDHVQRCSPR